MCWEEELRKIGAPHPPIFGTDPCEGKLEGWPRHRLEALLRVKTPFTKHPRHQIYIRNLLKKDMYMKLRDEYLTNQTIKELS